MFLRGVGSFAQQRAAAWGERQVDAARIHLGDRSTDETALHQTLDDDRDGALVGARARRQIVERERLAEGERFEHKELRSGDAKALLRSARGSSQDSDDASKIVEYRHDVGMAGGLSMHWYQYNRLGIH